MKEFLSVEKARRTSGITVMLEALVNRFAVTKMILDRKSIADALEASLKITLF